MSKVVDPHNLSDVDLTRAGIAGFGRNCGILEEDELAFHVERVKHVVNPVPFYVGTADIARLELARREALEQ
jgi:hypothetical protein